MLTIAFRVLLGLVILSQIEVSAADNIAKTVLGPGPAGENLLNAQAWHADEKGFEQQDTSFVCDNGNDSKAKRGLTQSVQLNQVRPEPIVASCLSRAEGVTGSPDGGYAVYLDLIYTDGTPLWGQTANFSTATHDWQRRQVVVLPDKPVKEVNFYLLLRDHAGKAWFRGAELHTIHPPAAACLFDGLPVVPHGPPRVGFQLRDVAAGSDYMYFPSPEALPQTRVDAQSMEKSMGIDVKAASIVSNEQKYQDYRHACHAYPGPHGERSRAFAGHRGAGGRQFAALAGRSAAKRGDRAGTRVRQCHAFSQAVGPGRTPRSYPLGAVADDKLGTALAIAPDRPAFCRIGYNAGSKELFIAYDLALTREQPKVELEFQRRTSMRSGAFGGALARYYELYPGVLSAPSPRGGAGIVDAVCQDQRVGAGVGGFRLSLQGRRR